MTTTSSYSCYSCEKNYAVASNGYSCISYTNDVNCRTLFTGNEVCYYCWHSYYWDDYVCRLKSILLIAIVSSLIFVTSLF